MAPGRRQAMSWNGLLVVEASEEVGARWTDWPLMSRIGVSRAVGYSKVSLTGSTARSGALARDSRFV